MRAILMLEDGKSFNGETAAVSGERIGEVVMNTAVVGYQEMITDPAYAGKILVLTYPLIGNYGIDQKFNESNKIWVSGLVIKEKSKMYSNWQATKSLEEFACEHNLLMISEIDTRTLAVHLRNKGQMLGIISTQEFNKKELLAKINASKKKIPESLLSKISVDTTKHRGGNKKKVAILDLGITSSILRQLETLGLSVTILPYNTNSQGILNLKIQGLIISGGPEEDVGLEKVAGNIAPLINKMPILGISTGCQVLARALGAKIIKMKLGHRGVNYPIHYPASFKGEITVQNHSCAIDATALSKIKNLKITAYNLNDRTVEEIESKKMRLLGVQYLPVSPGLGEVNSVLKRFAKMLKN